MPAPRAASARDGEAQVGRARYQLDKGAGWRWAAMALVWLVTVSAGAWLVHSNEAERRQVLRQGFVTQAQTGARFVGSFTRQVLLQEQLLARANFRGSVSAAVLARLSQDNGFQAAVVLDGRGHLLSAYPSDPALVGKEIGNGYAHLRGAMAGVPTVSGVVPSAVRGVPVVAFAIPFESAAGRRVFSEAYAVSNTPLRSYLLNETGRIPNTTYLVDANGEVVASGRRGPVQSGELAQVDPQLATAAEQSGARTIGSGASQRQVATIAVLGTPWRLVFSASTRVLYQPVSGWSVWDSRIVLIALALAGLIVIVLLQRALKQRRRLAEEHSRFRLLAQVVESAGEAISGRDLDGRFISWNPAAERLFGWTASEVIGHGLEHPMHGEQRDVVLAMIQAVTSTRTVQESETSRITDTGQSILIVVTMAPLFDEVGVLVGVSSSARDITVRRRLEDQLRQSESMFRSAFDGALLGMCLTGLDGRLVRVNQVFATMMGRSTAELTGMHSKELKHPDHRDARLQQAASGEIDGFRTEECYLNTDGAAVWADSATSVIHNLAGEPEHFVTQLVDVTTRRAALQERDAHDAMLAAVNARFSALVEHSSDAITVTATDGSLVYASPAFATLTGSETTGRVGQTMEELTHPDDRASVERSLGTLMADGDVTTYECRIRHATGGWRHIEVTASSWLDDPAVSGIVANARDVTERVEAAAELAHQAMHDLLTDLPNRALLLDRLDQALARAARSRRPSALLFVDLDRFKQINDSLGHAAGDQVLTTVAERLTRVVRPGDSVARLGGDEFVVLAEDIDDPSIVEEIAERIRAAVATPIIVGERAVGIGCSIGIAISDRHNPETLLQEADMALYQAKGAGRNRWELYDQAMRHLAQQRLDVEQLVRNAITGNQLEVHYQPVVDLRTGLITATEALVRIRGEDGRLVGPDEFITVAEDCGLIIALGAAVLHQACEQQARWRAEGAGLHHVAVNVSALQLVSGFASCVAAVLADTGLPADMLCLELTETALIDAGNASRQEIADIKALGVTLALDDFGTGWSSLAYLRRFPFDIVKIDRSFVDGLGTDTDDTEVVKAVIGLGQALGLRIVAEGVETDQQHRALRQLGCDHGQGYLYGRPGPAGQVPTGAVSIANENLPVAARKPDNSRDRLVNWS